MEKKIKYIKIPLAGVIFFSLLLATASFYSGYAWTKMRGGISSGTTAVDTKNSVVFAAEKSDKPDLSFYVMSFCPYGNQMEDVLRPVYDLLKDKANLTPHYIFDKISDIKSYCNSRSGDPSQCAIYVQNKYFTTEAECKKTISQNLATCLDEKAYLKTSDGSLYASLHGRQEANQNVREMCVWNQATDKKVWWDFVGAVNKNCTDKDADTCWEQQAKSVGLDTNKITDCFNKDAVKLIEQEIALTTKYKVQGSPTVLINDVIFPPEEAYTQDGKGSLKIGKKVATQDKYRTPNVVKEAICASFKKAPKECNTVLNELSGAAPGPGACN